MNRKHDGKPARRKKSSIVCVDQVDVNHVRPKRGRYAQERVSTLSKVGCNLSQFHGPGGRGKGLPQRPAQGEQAHSHPVRGQLAHEIECDPFGTPSLQGGDNLEPPPPGIIIDIQRRVMNQSASQKSRAQNALEGVNSFFGQSLHESCIEKERSRRIEDRWRKMGRASQPGEIPTHLTQKVLPRGGLVAFASHGAARCDAVFPPASHGPQRKKALAGGAGHRQFEPFGSAQPGSGAQAQERFSGAKKLRESRLGNCGRSRREEALIIIGTGRAEGGSLSLLTSAPTMGIGISSQPSKLFSRESRGLKRTRRSPHPILVTEFGAKDQRSNRHT